MYGRSDCRRGDTGEDRLNENQTAQDARLKAAVPRGVSGCQANRGFVVGSIYVLMVTCRELFPPDWGVKLRGRVTIST